MKFSKFLKTSAIAAALFLPWGTCALKTKEGQIWSWGAGRNGELGLGQETNSSLPRNIKNGKFVDLRAGKSISAAITVDGKLYTWGKNRNGLLGHTPPNLNVLLPREVEIARIKQVSCGSQLICAVSESGEAFVWGVSQPRNKFRQIGTSEVSKQSSSEVKPLKVDLQNIKQASCAGDYIALVNNKGRVFIMGPSKAKGIQGKQAKLPTDIIELDIADQIVRVESGPNFSMALNSEGRVYVWGTNTFGQLGTGSLNNLSEPRLLQSLIREKVVDISCGDNYSGVVTENGDVYTWGFGNEGQLGHGDKSDQFLPRKVHLNHKISKISCGGAHTALLTKEGKLFMMGRGREGQLGRENNDESSSGYSLQVKPVQQLPAQKISKVSCGSSHTLVLLEAL